VQLLTNSAFQQSSKYEYFHIRHWICSAVRTWVADALKSCSTAAELDRVELRECSRAGRRAGCELDSVMEFGLRHAHDVHTQVFVQLASSSRTSSRAGRRPACELGCELEFGFNKTSAVLIHGQVTIIFVVSVCLFVCLFVQSFSQPSLIRFRSN